MVKWMSVAHEDTSSETGREYKTFRPPGMGWALGQPGTGQVPASLVSDLLTSIFKTATKKNGRAAAGSCDKASAELQGDN